MVSKTSICMYCTSCRLWDARRIIICFSRELAFLIYIIALNPYGFFNIIGFMTIFQEIIETLLERRIFKKITFSYDNLWINPSYLFIKCCFLSKNKNKLRYLKKWEIYSVNNINLKVPIKSSTIGIITIE